MAKMDFTDDQGRHYRLNVRDVTILSAAGHRSFPGHETPIYDGTWIIQVQTQADKDDIHGFQWADGAQPDDFGL